MTKKLKLTIVIFSVLGVLVMLAGAVFLPYFFVDEFASIDVTYDGRQVAIATLPGDLLINKPNPLTSVSIYWKNLSDQTCPVSFAQNKTAPQFLDLAAGQTADAHFFQRGNTVNYNFCGQAGNFSL
jgi:hypothetical protein